MAVLGTRNVPVILVNFNDRTATYQQSSFNTLLFGTSTGSMKDFYSQASYGVFTVSSGPSGITGWYTAANGHNYYGNNDASGYDLYPATLAREAAAAADSSVDYSAYDADGDCYVDALNVVHQGTGEEASPNASDIWSHSWDLESGEYWGDGVGEYVTNDVCLADSGQHVKVNAYIMQPEKYGSAISTVGVFAHEFGHAIGLPDLYDVDYSSEGAGAWSLMAAGSWNYLLVSGDTPALPDAWCRYYLGWSTPTVVAAPVTGQSIVNAAAADSVFQLGAGTPTSGEYYLVENRQYTGFDQGLPGTGLLVWHIDGDWIAAHLAKNEVNDFECWPGSDPSCADQHYGVALVQADNAWQLNKGTSWGDAGDPFPGTSNRRSLTDCTLPSANLYDGAASLASVTSISDSALTMTADFQDSGEGADLSVTMTPAPDPPAGQAVLNIGVANAGPANQASVSLTVVLPQGLDYVSDTCTGSSYDGGVLTWPIGALASGGSTACTLTTAFAGCAPLTAMALVTGDPAACDPLANNTASVTVNEGNNILSDPGFEASLFEYLYGDMNPFWGEFSTNYGSPLCSLANCDGRGIAGPYSGDWWVWFGEVSWGSEHGAVSQRVTFPSGGKATLSFRLWIGAYGGTNNRDFLKVLVDGKQALKIMASNKLYRPGYRLVSLPLNAYADGKPHTVKLDSWTYGPGYTDISVDDVSLLGCDTVTIFFDPFANVLVDDWTLSGAWTVLAGGFLQSPSSGVGLASVTRFEPGAAPIGPARLAARMKLTGPTPTSGNGAIVFARQDDANYRWVRIRPGKLLIGQTGTVGGVAAGTKKTVSFPFARNAWYNISVRVYPNGTVKAYNGTKLLATHAFPATVAGGVGLQTTNARTLFDNVRVQDQSILR